MTLENLLSEPPMMHVISTEGGAFAAAVERPLYFTLSNCHSLQGGQA